jgi:hypothetical protein
VAFQIPEGQEGLADRIEQQFDALVRANVIADVFSATDLRRWLGNFRTPEEKYFAAKLLQSAVIRSWRMIDSSLRQVVDIIAPHLLRQFNLHQVQCLDLFESELQRDHPRIPIRFMAVDGCRIDVAAGNSGDAVLRRFGTRFQVGEQFRLRADRPESFVHDQPVLLVLLDDLLGTGTQITRFIHQYGLNPSPPNIHLVYVPLLATEEGLEKVRRECGDCLSVWPIEELDASAQFFHAEADGLTTWSRDGHNTVNDAREFYRLLAENREIGRERQFSLELTTIMPERCPNNSLRAYWATSGQWYPLKAR